MPRAHPFAAYRSRGLLRYATREVFDEAVAMAGRELTPDEALVVFRSAYGALPEKNAFRIEKWDHDASVYKICDAELARRSDVCIAEIIYLRKM